MGDVISVRAVGIQSPWFPRLLGWRCPLSGRRDDLVIAFALAVWWALSAHSGTP